MTAWGGGGRMGWGRVRVVCVCVGCPERVGSMISTDFALVFVTGDSWRLVLEFEHGLPARGRTECKSGVGWPLVNKPAGVRSEGTRGKRSAVEMGGQVWGQILSPRDTHNQKHKALHATALITRLPSSLTLATYTNSSWTLKPPVKLTFYNF